ncbi:MAG TPA: DUF5916 domain-containing protein [Thermoanaerobaculia bacterium]
MRPLRALLALLLLPTAAAAREAVPAAKSYALIAPRLAQPPVVDGRLAAGEWDAAVLLDGFIQLEPHDGAPATEGTEVRVGYDTHNLYLGIRGWDSEADKLVANILTRDGDLSYDDAVEVILDTYRDARSGFLFATNPLGVQVDGLVRNEGEEVDLDWDGIWRCAAQLDPQGFTVEMAVPFSTLRFRAAPEQVWGINVVRSIARKRETSLWKPISRDLGYYAKYKVSQFGQLAGLEGIEQGSGHRLKPYLIAGWENRTAERSGGELLDAGLDLKVNLGSDLVADFTYNTDFAESEADEQVVNLTRFPVLFPEKREFFLEGANLFYVGERPEPYRLPGNETFLFWSRRIGLTDDGRREIPVLGGGKLVGELGGVRVGVLSLTTEGHAYGPGQAFAEPRTNYSMVRLKRELAGGSSFGLVGLSTGPSGGDSNRVAGADWDLHLAEKLQSRGFLARSFTPGLHGDDWAGTADLFWDSKHSRFRLAYTDLGENFRDELGFVPRPGVRYLRFDSNAVLWPEEGRFRQAWFTYDLDYYTDRHGALETRIHNLQANTFLQSSAGLGLKFYDQTEVLDEPFEVHPGVVIPPGGYHFQHYFFGFQTDYTEPFGVTGRLAVGDYYDGRLLQTYYYAAYRPLAGLYTAVNYEKTKVELPAGDFTVELFLGEVTYSSSPRLSTRLWVQWSKEESVRSKFLFKWNYRPGADFYLVYEDLRDLDPLNPLRRLIGQPGRTLLTKTVFLF